MKNYLLLILLITTSSCVVNSKTTAEIKDDEISKTYYIQGMTCGGCIYHVKKALNEDSKLIRISEKSIEVGKVTVIFRKNDYKGSDTDCSISKSIELRTGYKVFNNKRLTISSCKKEQKVNS